MLFVIFLTLLSLSIIFMALGFFMDLPVISLFGALLLLGLGLTMLATDVEVKTGDITNISYNGTTATSLTTTYNYQDYDFGTIGQSSYGWLIAILGALLFVIFLFSLGGY